MLRVSKILLLLIILTMALFAHDGNFLSAGFKVGYTFGASGGFTFGFESSLNWDNGKKYWPSVVLAIDRCSPNGLLKYHAGAEISTVYGAGVEWGPTIVSNNSEISLAHSLTPYVGFIIIPYYSITFVGKGENINEAGTYLKFPVPLSGQKLSQ